MTSSHITKLLPLFILAVLTAGMASAEIIVTKYEHDTTWNSAFQETRACSCGITTDYFLLQNRGDFHARYRLNIESPVDWVELTIWEVWLDPGEETVIPVTVMPPCDSEESTTYKVYATSEYGRFRVADRILTSHTCENIGLNVLPAQQSILPCREARWSVNVKNTGTFEDRYTLGADSEYVSFATRHVTLAPGEEASVDAWTSWACNEYGERIVTFNAHAARNDLATEQKAVVNILWDYDFIVDVAPKPQDICAEVTTERDITIINTAQTQNTYTLSTGQYATLSRETLTVQPGEAETIKLFLRPDESNVGAASIPVRITSENGGVDKTVYVETTARDCFENEVVISPNPATVCAGDNNFSVQVRNQGEWLEEFTLRTGGDIFSEVQPESFMLRPGEHLNAVLHAVVPDRDDSYDVTVDVTQSPGLTETATLELEGVSNANCTLVTTDETRLHVYMDTGVVPFIITNEGLEATTYTLFWEGKVFSLEEEEVFLAPGEQAVLHLVPQDVQGLDEGDYVERFALTSHRSEYRLDFHIDLEEKGFFTKVYDRVFSPTVDWCLFLLGILLILTVVALLLLFFTWLGAIPKSNAKRETKKTAGYVLGVIALLFIILAAISAALVPRSVAYVDQPVGSNYSMLYFETPMNEELVIDLSQFFTDPDRDNLTFSASNPEHLTLRVEGDTAFAYPTRNWYGQENVVFTATDSLGAMTDSPIMTVRVLQTRPDTFWGFVAKYCAMLNWLFLALLTLLLIAYLFLSPDKQLEKRYGQPIRAMMVPPPREDLPMPPAYPGAPSGPVVHGDAVRGDKHVHVGKAPEELYVTSTGGKKIHRPECMIASRVPKEKRLIIRGKDAALQEGYSPCKVCSPFGE